MEVIASKEIVLPTYADMPRNHRVGGVQLDLLYPPQDFLERKNSQKWRNSNNNSLVVKVSFGSISFLFPGDIMAAAEKELTRIAGDNLSSTVLIAPHHGSRTSSSEIFLDHVSPEVVIISSSPQRRARFPHPSVLKRYEHRGYTVHRTDINGAVCVSTDGQHLLIKPYLVDEIAEIMASSLKSLK